VLAERREVEPIVVHADSMRVIDGVHRVRAAYMRGDRHVLARMVWCSDVDAFALAVRLNTRHGLQLARADRIAALGRILASFPNWSDRRIAAFVGLSTATVSERRKRSTAQTLQPNARVGRDGRLRPVNAVEGRLRASQIISKRPDASLREVAREAGIAVSTAQDVRRRMCAGEDPLTPRMAAGERSAAPNAGQQPPITRMHDAAGGQPRRLSGDDLASAVERLRKDPSVRLTETGRGLLRILEVERAALAATAQSLDALPGHCVATVAAIVHSYARAWADLADRLDPELPRAV
jgi:hypothetical protein